MKHSLLLVVFSVLIASSQAGIYSTALSNQTPGAPDPGIPGFVGPAGDGITPTATNGNYVNPIFVGWADGVVSYLPAPNVASQWTDVSKTLGPVTGNNFDIASLGDLNAQQIADGVAPGQITLSFSMGIRNGPGADFAVFENGFISGGKIFAELGYVEVSTNGSDFARFPSVYTAATAPVGAYGTIDPTGVYNLVGKHVNAYGNSWGTPFDLQDLNTHPLVQNGKVNLMQINYVRVVDIPGSGDFKDSLGNSIYDAWVTWGSGGVDLEAVGIIHAVPEPATLVLLGLGSMLFLKRRKQS